jgi:hypothetical protein
MLFPFFSPPMSILTTHPPSFTLFLLPRLLFLMQPVYLHFFHQAFENQPSCTHGAEVRITRAVAAKEVLDACLDLCAVLVRGLIQVLVRFWCG